MNLSIRMLKFNRNQSQFWFVKDNIKNKRKIEVRLAANR